MTITNNFDLKNFVEGTEYYFQDSGNLLINRSGSSENKFIDDTSKILILLLNFQIPLMNM